MVYAIYTHLFTCISILCLLMYNSLAEAFPSIVTRHYFQSQLQLIVIFSRHYAYAASFGASSNRKLSKNTRNSLRYMYIPYISILILFSMSTVTRPTRPRGLSPCSKLKLAVKVFECQVLLGGGQAEPGPVRAINQHSAAECSSSRLEYLYGICHMTMNCRST